LEQRSSADGLQSQSQSQTHLLAKGLRGNQFLRCLDLGCIKIIDEDLIHLADVLWTCSKLQTLYFRLKHVTEGALERRAQKIPASLKVLNLWVDGFTEERAGPLVFKILHGNPRLFFIDVRFSSTWVGIGLTEGFLSQFLSGLFFWRKQANRL
jgi:hypothetical protein